MRQDAYVHHICASMKNVMMKELQCFGHFRLTVYIYIFVGINFLIELINHLKDQIIALD